MLYRCIGTETVLTECIHYNLKGCRNLQGDQIGISCESNNFEVPFQLPHDIWLFSLTLKTSKYTLYTLLIHDLLILQMSGGDTLAGFSVYVSDTPDWTSGTLCYQHDINEPFENSVSIDCFITGRYVTIYNSRNGSLDSPLSSFAYINICEVNVTGKCFVDRLIFQ